MPKWAVFHCGILILLNTFRANDNLAVREAARRGSRQVISVLEQRGANFQRVLPTQNDQLSVEWRISSSWFGGGV